MSATIRSMVDLFTKNKYSYCFALLFFTLPVIAHGDTLEYYNNNSLVNVPAANITVLEDTSNKLSFQDVRSSAQFVSKNQSITNLGISNSAFWLKFSVKNNSGADLLMAIQQPMIEEAELYAVDANGSYVKSAMYKHEPFYKRPFSSVDYIFNLNLPQGAVKEYFLKVKSAAVLVLPVKVGTHEVVMAAETNKELLFGIYAGIILVMAIYNLFVYFTVRDKSYLLYVAYILLIGLTQVSLQGFTDKYLWPGSSWMSLQEVNIFSCLVAIAALEFLRVFLRTKQHVPKLHYAILGLNILFLLGLILTLTGARSDSFKIMQSLTGIASLFALFVSYKVYRLNYRPARFFLLAWSILLVGAVVFVLKDFGVVPYNNLTTYAVQIASVAEVVLLSFALADKINIFRKEREAAQAEALAAVEENSRIVREQNVILEAKVAERTVELKESNDGLSKALVDLKEAEMQLVESEKMASLGQLTAGIAHEINNPINFVTSNVKPLKRDVEMVITMLGQIEEITLSEESLEGKKQKISELKEEYDFDYLKTEIDYLLNGINEGSSRTAEIVKGLRIFSRLDEDDLKRADINEGLDSTLVIVNNQLDNKIDIVKQYSPLPLTECYPGKLNQVFLNIITNGLYAIKAKFKDEKGGQLTITTSANEENVIISIIDNGTGMDESTKKKLFEPFFTTKDVGEGTGLGLSIAYNTIVKHNGTIDVNSTLGEGTEFVIEIPIIHKQVQIVA